ncbi:MAG TPA: ParB/RepB/Spo0J family partition protein [Blastocatellia bacterium]|nr:ParB/RepB/Spo0J family partition protein [Blastocatellia bacterium]
MNKQKRTIDLDRFAAESRNDSSENSQPDPAARNDRLQKLLNNIGRTVILPTSFLTIRDNIRQILDTSSPEFRQLVESIRKHGVKQNLIGDLRVDDDGQWQIICVAGQRRLLAAKEVGLETIPVRLEQYTDETALLVDSLSENILRQNLHCLDAALGYLRLFNQGWKPDDIAAAFERKRDTVMKMLRLARYPQSAQEIVRLYPEKFTSTILLTKFVAKSWPDDHSLVQALKEFAVQERKRHLRATISDFEVKELESKIADKGIRSKSKGTQDRGVIILAWNSQEEFVEIKKILSALEGN